MPVQIGNLIFIHLLHPFTKKATAFPSCFSVLASKGSRRAELKLLSRTTL